MSNNQLAPEMRDVAVLMDSESESDDGLRCVIVDSSEESGEDRTLTGFISFKQINTGDCENTSNETVNENVNETVNVSASKQQNGYTHLKPNPVQLEEVQNAATVTPKNKDDDEHNEFVRNEVLNTCKNLLTMLETVRVSVLHLQYSVHAGETAAVQVETTDRSSRLWNWDTSLPSSDIFKFDVANELKLSDQDLSELEVFGADSQGDEVTTILETNLDANQGANIENHIVVEDQLDPDQDQEPDYPIETSITKNGDGGFFYDTTSTGCF